MPVRIIFQGLMLFQLPESGPKKGKLFVFLINKPGFGSGAGAASTRGKALGHHHSGDIQILAGGAKGEHLIAHPLKWGVDLDIIVPQKGVTPTASYNDHVPELGAIIEAGTEAVRAAGWDKPNGNLITNMVTIDGGTLRVNEVIKWDQGGFPLSGVRNDIGAVPGSLALMNFVGSGIRGHMDGEVVIDIDADEIELRCAKDKELNGNRRGSPQPNHNVPPNTVEIIIRNYENRSDKPTPWGLDFQWLIEAAGYGQADLRGDQFDRWVKSGNRYDSKLFDDEYRAFLGDPAVPPLGRPFPYIQSEQSLTQLQPLSDKHNPPVCVRLRVKVTYTETVTNSDGSTTTRTVTVEMDQVPRPDQPPSSDTST